jgi:uncharacterized 2Fe-2S/4Fe-4S cluster protein (DUF4445 family)
MKLPVTISLQVAASKPSLDDNRADLDRLKTAVQSALPADLHHLPLYLPFACMARLAARWRKAGFQGWVLLHLGRDHIELFDFFAEQVQPLPVMALDLGSTHLEASLMDSLSGTILASGTTLNLQVQQGADILTRLHIAGHSEGLQELQQAALDSCSALLEKVCHEAGLEQEQVVALAVAGNTTMIHLFLGLDPSQICREPYIPLVNAPDPFRASELGLNLHPQAKVWVLPSRGSYFGGDLFAGILATGLDQAEQPTMLIDVGTNAEVVLGTREWLLACAGAAGPALEGGVASMGMRACAGAIAHVRIDREAWKLHWKTIEAAQPCGLCGSGLIDLAAELYVAQLIDCRGRLQQIKAQNPAHQRFMQQHLIAQEEGGLCFIVVPADEAAGHEAIKVSQCDLDGLMRSKAAMYAVLETLTAHIGINLMDLERIQVAGAFGKHIDPQQAITLGMLPDLSRSVFQAVGNTSLRGAELFLQDQEIRERAAALGQKITYLELNVNQDFMLRFSGALFIPHTQAERFPRVPLFR